MATMESIRASASYLDLIAAFPPRPIRNDEELDRATARVDALIDQGNLSSDEKDYLFLIGLLIEDYERSAHPAAPLTDAELLRDLLAEKGMTQTQLAAEAGIADSTLSAVLAGKRQISKGHIAAFARIFAVSPALFFAE